MQIHIKLESLRYLVFVLSGISVLIFSGCGNQDFGQLKDRSGKIQSLEKDWEKTIPNQAVPEGLESLSASECGECHEEIYREWQESNHAVALQDLQFQAEWAKDDSLWVCLNCHTPLQNQQEFIVLGKRDNNYFKPVRRANPDFDPELKEESITCAVCHVRNGAVIGTHGDRAAAPHKVKKDSAFLSRNICLGCHNITDVLTPGLICSFQTGDEWEAGPYPELGRDCVSCHMPQIYRPSASGGTARFGRRHTWIGSAVPKVAGAHTIVPGYRSGLEIDVQSFPKKLAAGDSAFLTVSVANQRAGHYLPTGDPEYFFTLTLRLINGNQNTLKDTTFKIGQEWKWWPEAQKLSDNRLKPLEQRSCAFAVKTPATPDSLYWEIILTTHRMTAENAAFTGLLGKYPIQATFYRRKIRVVQR